MGRRGREELNTLNLRIMATVWVIVCYLGALLAFALGSKVLFRGTSNDYFVASRSIGPFMLLMSVFGTTMTAFALVGSTGKAFERGIGTYGLMASSSGLIHAACFFLIGVKIWSIGKRHGFVTQIQFFRARFGSTDWGILFPISCFWSFPTFLLSYWCGQDSNRPQPAPSGAFPKRKPDPEWERAWLTGLVICGVHGHGFAGSGCGVGQYVPDLGIYGDGFGRIRAHL